MEQFRCKKENANFVGMNPLGVFFCPEQKLSLLFNICIKNKYSILEKPNKDCQKLILDLDKKDEEIELKNFGKPVENETIKSFETYFTNLENSVDWIEDIDFKNKVLNIIDNIEEEGEPGPNSYKNALLDGIEDMKNTNGRVIQENWDELILKGEKEKFLWKSLTEILKTKLIDYNITFSPSSKNFYNFMVENKNIEITKTPKTGEINGIKYKRVKIFARKANKTFRIIENKEFHEFLDEIKNLEKNANSIIEENMGIYSYSETNRSFAEDYIIGLRETQKELIEKSGEDGEEFEMEEFNEINTEIRQIRENKKFKFREKVWKKRAGWFVKRAAKFLWRFLWNYKKTFFVIIVSIAGAITTAIKYEMTVNDIKAGIKRGVKNMGKTVLENIKKLLKQFGRYAWFSTISAILGVSGGIFLKLLFAFLGFSVPFFRIFILIFSSSFASLAGITYILVDYIFKNWGSTLIIISYYLYGKMPPEEVIENLADDKKLPVEKFKEQYLKPENFFQNTFAYLMSYPIGLTGRIITNGGEVLEELLNLLISIATYASITFAVIIFLYILMKWRG